MKFIMGLERKGRKTEQCVMPVLNGLGYVRFDMIIRTVIVVN